MKQSMLLAFFCVITMVALATMTSCTQEPAQIVYHKTIQAKKTDFSPKKDINLVTPYKINVEEGQSLYEIAKLYNADLRDIIDLNRLRPPYKLSVGQQIKLPRATYHTVKPKDTLYDISRGYGIDMTSIVSINNLDYPYTIQVGQKLKLPSKTQLAEYEKDYNDEDSYTTNNYSVDSSDNKSFATNSKPYKTSKISTSDIAPVTTTNNAQSIPQPNLKNKQHASSNTQRRFEQAAISNNPLPLDKPAKISANNKNFVWPVEGKIISEFGPKKGGLYNDGVNISAPENTPVKSASSGTVVYAGNELKGYGNLLLIKHDNGYLTAYAHAKELKVRKGDYVTQGQTIASIGKTGNVNTPQLHFSIRKGRRALNPVKFM